MLLFDVADASFSGVRSRRRPHGDAKTARFLEKQSAAARRRAEAGRPTTATALNSISPFPSKTSFSDQLVTLIGAGHDTSAYFLCYACFEKMARHLTYKKH